MHYIYILKRKKRNCFWEKHQPSKNNNGSKLKKKKKSKASHKRKLGNIRPKISGSQCYCITYLTMTRCAGIYFLCCVFPCLTG